MHALQHFVRVQSFVTFKAYRKYGKSLIGNQFRPPFRSLSEVRKKEEHLIRTASQFRQHRMYEGIVYKIEDPSDDVRTISLKVNCPGLTFKAGQWVDFYIPGVLPVVGFSMTSPPYLAEAEGILDLAVRYSIYPPTFWIHKQCKLGDAVTIRVGGEFFYDPESKPQDTPHDLLLIGGGVGINPLVSIAQHYAHLITTGKLKTNGPQNKMVILYSAKNQNGLVFKDVFRTLAQSVPSLTCRFFATSEPNLENLPEDTSKRRITREDVESALSVLNKKNVVGYICGPSSMTDDMEALLLKLGLPSDRVCFEKWW